jgi:uncharacterized membrane protein
LSYRKYFYPPALGFFLYMLIILTLVIVFPILLLGVTKVVFGSLGFSFTDAVLIILLSLAGSAINIPIAKIRSSEPVMKMDYYTFFGVTYPVPNIFQAESETLVSVNVGGALIPTVLSAYIWTKELVYTPQILIAVIVLAIVVNRLAKPVKGMGIVVPAFVPPLLAAVVALVLSLGDAKLAFSLAYMSGSLGTLIGADLLNIRKFGELSAKAVSIGGAGTFDGVFMSGLIAVLLVALL